MKDYFILGFLLVIIIIVVIIRLYFRFKIRLQNNYNDIVYLDKLPLRATKLRKILFHGRDGVTS